MIFLNPCNDVAFKKIFGSEEHKSITISFLNSMLELTGDKTIVWIDFLNTEQLPQMPEKKDNVLDIICVDQSGTRYIVEMQVARVQECGKRMVFYGAKTYSMQLGKGRSYRLLMPVVVLSIVHFIMFPEKKAYKSIHKLLDVQTHENDLDELTFAFVELPKFYKTESELETIEDKWLFFMKYIKKQDHIPASFEEEELIEACDIAKRMKWSEDALNAYDDAFVRETDEEGKLELAIEEGMQKGLEQGLQKGLRQGKLEIVHNLLKLSLTIADIVSVTGLSEEEIVQIKNSK